MAPLAWALEIEALGTLQTDLLKGRVAVVTGATSNGGIGAASAFYLAELGVKV